MKMIKILTVAIMVAIGFAPAASAYQVDGKLNDWGISLTGAGSWNKGYLDNQTPTGADTDYFREDNADIYNNSTYIGPGYTVGNTYDAEAIYMSNDYDYLYIAIVTGVSPSEATYPAGDIFFDTGYYQDPLSATYSKNQYAFGIDVLTGSFYKTTSWVDTYFTQNSSNPWIMGNNKTLIGSLDFIYTQNSVNSHYVMETKIPLAFLNLDPNKNADVWAHWTMLCGNDILNLKGDIDPLSKSNAVPEPATMMLMASGLVGLGLRRKKAVKV